MGMRSGNVKVVRLDWHGTQQSSHEVAPCIVMCRVGQLDTREKFSSGHGCHCNVVLR